MIRFTMAGGEIKLLKIIMIALSLILILNFINSLFGNNICCGKKNNTLYVGGLGIGNYTFIQDAIDNSSVNDTIFVFNGVYNESILIDKSLNLEGFDKNFTIIQSNHNLYNIYIKSSEVNISNFTIKNGKMGIYLSNSNYSNNTIYENIFLDNLEGIRFYKSSNNKIIKNYFSNNIESSIVFYESNNNLISRNYIEESQKAFFLGRWSNKNIISKNNFTKNDLSINLDHSFNNLLYENSLREGTIGIGLSFSNNNNISDNNLNVFTKYGIYLTNSEENIILSNNFSNNYIDIKEGDKPPSVKAPGIQMLLAIFAIFIVFLLKIKK